MGIILQTAFLSSFSFMQKLLSFDSNLTEICSQMDI